MNILYLTKYSRQGASSRLRSYQYIPFLEEKEHQVNIKPLFNDIYLERLYKGEMKIILSFKSYFKRFLVLFTVLNYDRIIIEKELFPYFPATFEKILALLKIKYIVDYDDAIFHNYDINPNPIVRFLLKNKIDIVMKMAGTVIAGNSYLATRAKKSGAKNIIIIPTVIDTSRYQQKKILKNNSFVIGWIGSPSTFKYLKVLKPVFMKLIEKHNITLHIVGAQESLGFPNIEKHIKWSEHTEVDSILAFDVGIMPLNDTPWEKGKCSYKLIQYMGCGIPVIASSVGMNIEVVGSDNGFLAKTDEEWFDAFESYIQNEELQFVHGKNNSIFVKNNFSLISRQQCYLNSITGYTNKK